MTELEARFIAWAQARRDVRADNAEAIEFYRRLGFRFSGFNDRLYSNRDHEDGSPTLYLHLELA